MRRALTAVLSVAAAMHAAAPEFAWAHGGGEVGEHPWDAWNVTWDVAIPTALFLVVYLAGALRRRTHDGAALSSDAAFLGGLAFVFLALASPVDPIAERSFVMHQVQHLMLRMFGPMLIALAAPQAALLRGLPTPLRQRVVGPAIASRPARAVFGILTQPVIVTALFIGVLYFWQVPYLHNLSVLNEAVHYAMHGSMLAAGLLFWWRMFDRRPPPQGARYGVRLFMLWLMVLSTIVIGAYLALKPMVLYPAYDQLGRILETEPLADEQLGAATIWIPGSMMGVLAVIIVIHMWGRIESRWDARGDASAGRPATAGQLYAEQRGRNRRLALGFATFVLAVFASAVSTGLLQVLEFQS